MIIANRKEWYEDLIGKEVDWYNTDGEYCPGIVTRIHYDLGFTIQAAKNYGRFEKEEYLSCYRGPSFPGKDFAKADRDMAHRRYVSYIAACIREGKVDFRKIYKMREHLGCGSISTGPSAAGCSFSQ